MTDLSTSWRPSRPKDTLLTGPAVECTGDDLPAVVLDVEISEAFPYVPGVTAAGRRVQQAWALVRLHTEPLGAVLVDVPLAGLRPSSFAAAASEQLGIDLPADGLPSSEESPFLAGRREVLSRAPHITVVICTRERPDALARCLDSLLGQNYPDYRILVVENAPSTDATALVVADASLRGPVDYLVEPRAGLSFARNAAVAAVPGKITAWIDDDEYADPNWLAEVARALDEHPAADVVSGVIVPAELETRAQLWFEQFGGHSKGRGFTPAVFSPATAHLQSPLYPLPPFGTGANMTFRAGVIERIGGFDVALGAGTPAMGSEDTLAFTQVLLTGGTIVYQPSAVTHHYHRRDLDGLRKQMVGYGTGLIAAYVSLLMSQPRLLWPLLRLAPAALRDLTGKDSLRVSTLRDDFPRELLKANRRGMLAGPRAYFQGRKNSRRLGPGRPDSGRLNSGRLSSGR